MAARSRRAIEKLDLAQHEVLIRGPEGAQKHWDEKGKRVKSKARVEYTDFEKYRESLRVEAGLVDQELEKLVAEIKRNDAFWGEAPPLSGDEAVVDEDSAA